MHETTARILSAAKSLFNRHGLRKTTVEEIARDAGVGKGTVYNYFESKEAIFLAAKRNECSHIMQKFRAAIRSEKKGSRQLIKFVSCWHQEFEDHRKKYPFSSDIFSEFEELSECAIVQSEFQRDTLMLLRGIVETGLESGEFRVADIDIACWTIMITLSGLAVSHFIPTFDISEAAKPEIIGSMLVTALSHKND